MNDEYKSCKKVLRASLALVAQWIRRRSPKPKIGGSSPPEGNHIFFRGPLMNCQSMNPQWITLGAIL